MIVNRVTSILLVSVLLMFHAVRANANPLVLSSSDIELIKQEVLWGNIVILLVESFGASIFMKFFKYRISRTLIPVFAMNLAVYLIFRDYLFIYEKHDVGISFFAEMIIILLETIGLFLISKMRFIRAPQTGINPVFCFFAVAFLNVFSAIAGLAYSFTVAESVAYPLF